MLRVRLLGSFEIIQDNSPIAITSRPAQSLFAYLVLNAGTAHRREKLAGMLWPDSLEETARDNLRHALWRVRKALPVEPGTGYLLADDLSIGFNASADYWLDAAELERVGESASTDELISVLAAYQGELLPGFYDEWVVLEREHLQSVFEHKMARLLELLQDEGRWLEVLEWAERWIALGQKPEPAYRALMTAHAAKGDMSKVAATYERCVKSLREFGIEPSEQTKELYENLKSGKETPGNLPLQKKLVAREAPASIPVPLTSFVGREKELKEIARLLAAARLLTLTGPGGVGKTRLAIQTSQASVRKFKDGVCWVELVGLQDGSLIPQGIVKALGAREVSNQAMLETLKAHLKAKELLLVLDNCEHLIETCAQTVESLLGACPQLKILATSRERLDLFNETTWNVPSLPLPEMQGSLSLKQLKEFASIQLFVERAGNVKSDFTLTEQNAFSVAQICDHLDGIPLAIELASARIKVLSVDEIASRLNDRFSLLTSGSRTAQPRHQTLRATIDWSHDLLTEPERILLRRLSVFAGGFTLEAVEAVCGFGELKPEDVLDLLARLVDKSLAIVQSASLSTRTRYRLLETIREYGREKLKSIGELDLTRDRHLEFFMRLAEEAELHHFSPEQLVWFGRMEAEIDNFRAAMEWSIPAAHTEDPKTEAWRQESGLRVMGALVWFWHRSYARETSERLRQMLETTNGPTLGRAKALYSLGFLYWVVNNFSEARRFLEEAVAISRELEDRLALGWSLGYLGAVAAAEGDYASARTLLEESLSLARELGPAGRKAVSWALAYLGEVHFAQGDYPGAKRSCEEAVALTRESHERNMIGFMIRRLGYVALKQHDNARATQYFSESLQLNREVGHAVGICACLTAFANLALAEGNPSLAAQLFGAVENYLKKVASPLWYADKIEYQLGVSGLRNELGGRALEKAWTEGVGMTLEQAIALALEPS